MPALFSEVRAVFFDLDDTLCGYWDACKAALRECFTEHAPDGHEVDALVCRWAEAFRAFAPGLRELGLYEGYLKSGAHTRAEQMRRTHSSVGDRERGVGASDGATIMESDETRTCGSFQTPSWCWTDYERRITGWVSSRTVLPTFNDRRSRRSVSRTTSTPIYIEGEVGYGKPDDRVLRNAAIAVDLPTERILFVGNSYRHDIEPAIRAGWRTAWVRRPSDVPPSADPSLPGVPEDRPEGSPEPDVVLTDLAEILPLLGMIERPSGNAYGFLRRVPRNASLIRTLRRAVTYSASPFSVAPASKTPILRR